MEIERVNEYTIKFFISYGDIESRGFEREEIWYNRERGEELFWEMMDEANHQESFPLEGPLWIQVQALEKGLEIVVTRAQVSKDGSKLELPISQDKHLDIPVSESLEHLLSESLEIDESTDEDDEDEAEDESPGELAFLIAFHDFEDCIALSEGFDHDQVNTALYAYKNRYYLDVTFNEDMSEHEQENALSRILEYGDETGLTVHVVEEYGNTIIQSDALKEIRKHFVNR